MLSRTLGRRWLACGILLILCGGERSARAQAQPVEPYFSRKNTFGFLAAYSNDSSHILMGQAENRKLLNFGAIYSRRLFQNGKVNWQYTAELLPVALESDPVEQETLTEVSPPPAEPIPVASQMPIGPCHTSSGSFTETFQGVVYTYDYNVACTRRWTIGEGMSPIGFQWNFLPRHKLQPILLGHGGYMYSTQPIPVASAGSFNFTFDIGAGLELYRNQTRSIRLDYRYHHISDHYTTNVNPGIDNGLLTVTYAFGK